MANQFLTGFGTLFGGAGNAGNASSNAWNYGQYSPFTINNPMGNIGWNGTTANATLSPLQQGLQNSFAGAIQGGLGTGYNPNTSFLPQQYQQIFSPGAFQQGVNDQFGRSVAGVMPFLQQASQSNLDNEFSKGTLASTAGGYQTAGQNMATGGVLANLYNTAFGNQLGLANSQFGAAANTNAQGEQQAEFRPQIGLQGANLGLSGLGQQNTNLLQMLQAGGNLGAQRSGANVAAATPGIETGMVQDNATAGLLSGLLFGGGTTGGLLNGLLGGSGSGTSGLAGLLGKVGGGVSNLIGGNPYGFSGSGQDARMNAGYGNDISSQYNNDYSYNSGYDISNLDTNPDLQNVGADSGNNWWDNTNFNAAGGEAANGLQDLGVSDVGGLSSEVRGGINGASTGNSLGNSGLLGEVGAGTGLVQGLMQGGVKGNTSALLDAAKIYNDTIGHSGAFNQALGTVGSALNVYNGITSGTPQGYASAALSGTNLAAQAGAFGGASAGVAAAAGAIGLGLSPVIMGLSTPAVQMGANYYPNLAKTIEQAKPGTQPKDQSPEWWNAVSEVLGDPKAPGALKQYANSFFSSTPTQGTVGGGGTSTHSGVKA